MASAPRPALAFHLTEGTGPTIVFLPGYASDMTGTKVLALEAWARAAGRRFLRFDYAGCGRSEGAFEEQTLATWRDDTIELIDELAPGPVVLVGSSMGGWLMLLVARERPDRVQALVGIAAAPDFTDWGFSIDDKMTLLRERRLERPNPYGDAPTVTTAAFWQSGEAHRVLGGPIAFDGPVRLLHGQADRDVPWERGLQLFGLFRSADVQLTLIKDGDHRLSRDADIRLLLRTVEELPIS